MAHPSRLEDLIAPLTREEFTDRYWETNFLHISQRQPDIYDSLFSLQDVDRWLMTTRSGASESVLLIPPEGSNGNTKSHRPEDLAIESVYEAFTNGHSVVLNELESSWTPLLPLVKTLRRNFCADVGVNLYLTPKGSKAFPLHIDDHDVFVLQIHGEKSWTLHKSVFLPVNHSRLTYRKDLSFRAEWSNGRIQTPVLANPTLQPGDFLYIPRGMPHYATAKSATSLHLTFSIIPLYWMDFLKAAIEQTHFSVPELRSALPVEILESIDTYDMMREKFLSVLEAFQRQVSFDETFEVIRRNRVRAQSFPADGHFSQLERLSELTLDSEVGRRDNISCIIEDGPSHSTIRFGTKFLRGPMRLRRAFEFIREHPSFMVSEIPSLDDKSRMVLVRRLIREGLLRFVGQQPSLEVEPVLPAYPEPIAR